MTDPEFIDGEERPLIRMHRRYPHPVDRVWRAISEAENLRGWFPGEAAITPRVGGVVRFDVGGDGLVITYEPPHRLAFTWGGELLEFELTEDGDGTVLVLTHHFDDRGGAASFATGWEQCLAAMSDVLAGREPATTDRGERRHEELVTRFGLDRPRVDRTDSGWLVRFERQLICDAGVAWDLFFGRKVAPAVGEEFRPFAAPEVVLGVVTESSPNRAFAFTTAEGEPGDRVRLAFGEGTGHGARLILEVEGSDDDELEVAIDQWGAGAIGHVVQEAARLAGIAAG